MQDIVSVTVTNLLYVQVGQSLTIVVIAVSSVELGGVTVAGMSDTVVVVVGFDPGIVMVMGEHVGQGLYSVSVEFCPGVVTREQAGQGLYTVSVEPDPGILILIGGQVGQGL